MFLLDMDVVSEQRRERSSECARLHVPDKLGERDAMIAATALVHRMTVVTRNVADLEASGVLLVNPWLGRRA